VSSHAMACCTVIGDAGVRVGMWQDDPGDC